MKKTLIILIIVAIVVVAAKMTVPPIEKHYEVASKQLASFVEEKVIEGNEFDEIIGEYVDKEEVMKFLSQEEVYKPVIRYMVENMLFLEDYFVCNVGKFTYEEEVYPLTLGLFGHVFVLSDYYDELQHAGMKVEEYKKKLE
jgi:short subunit fatty acids transporter